MLTFLDALRRQLIWLPLLLSLSVQAAEPLVFDAGDSRTLRQISDRLQRDHYRKLHLDDAIASRFLDALLDGLDPERHFFLQADVSEFNTYRNRLDDQARSGDLSAATVILNRYRQRALSRLESEISSLPQRLATLDFTVEEYFNSDRSQAAWPADKAAADELWRLAIKAMAVDLMLAGKDMSAIADLLVRRLQGQRDRLQRLNDSDFFDIYVNTLASLFDPHTHYLSPARAEQFNISMKLSLEGIGATLQQEALHVRVVSLVPAGPADKQGQLQPLDRIVGVGQGDAGALQDVVGWRLDDVVGLIRGPKGSVVRLEVIPATAASEAERRLIRIVRDQVKLEEQAASGHLLDIHRPDGSVGKVGVIRLPTFYIDFDALYRGDPDYRSTTRDVRRLIEELKQQGAEGLVIDLRNNGGGSLKEATELTGLFIDNGPIVQIRQSNELISRESKSPFVLTPVYRLPLVVMVNRLSASASEIFAAAIQDYGRGVVVGSPTFGKGTVQNLSQIGAGALKLTVSKFYRISGGSTQHRGVEPDIHLPSIYRMDDIGESSYSHALPWDSIHRVRHSVYYPIPELLPALDRSHRLRLDGDADFRFVADSLAMEAGFERTRIALQLEQRRTQLAEWRQQALTLDNARRKAKGLPLREAWPEEDGDADDALASRLADRKAAEDDNLYTDMYLIEGAQVLLDLAEALRHKGFYGELAATGSR